MKLIASIMLLVAGLAGIVALLPEPAFGAPDENGTAFVKTRIFTGVESTLRRARLE